MVDERLDTQSPDGCIEAMDLAINAFAMRAMSPDELNAMSKALSTQSGMLETRRKASPAPKDAAPAAQKVADTPFRLLPGGNEALGR
jgi:hypothetical protein